MSAHANPDIITNGLVFGFDTGYPLVSQSHETYRYNRGEPTTTFNVGTMVPTNPNTAFTSNATFHNNLHGTIWDWSYYPDSNISSDGGMEWVPNYRGPGFTGAWKMKKRAGGNSESNFSGIAPGSIDSSKTYTVSVWCKTDQASMARIHVNTTRSGSSYWGYGSSYHSGGGDWERLSVTIYGGEGNTSINTIRCQCVGTTINADAYWRDYQIEERSHATPFILGGTRSATGSLIDLTGTTNIDVSNASFDSNAQITFDGTDDYFEISDPNVSSSDGFSVELIIKPDNPTSSPAVIVPNSGGIDHWIRFDGNGRLYIRMIPAANSGGQNFITSTELSSGNYHHVVFTFKQSEGGKAYYNGALETSAAATLTALDWSGIWRIGQRGNNTWFLEGELPMLKIYNKTLTTSEVLQNFNATKSRFGL
jgi:hypothetical protein